MPDSVLCCEANKDAIVYTMKKALSDEFHKEVQSMGNPFGEGKTSKEIVEILRLVFEQEGTIKIAKPFFDLEVKK